MLKELEDIIAPFTKLAELNKATLEKVAADQKANAEEVVALTEARLKAVAEIKDIEGLQAFVQEQVELAKAGTEKAVANNQALLKDTQAYVEEVIGLFQQKAAKPAPKARKKVAKKAAAPKVDAVEAVEPA